MDFDFIDFATKAKELGLTESSLRAKILSRLDDFPCFVYVNDVLAYGSQDRFLPPWSEESFPHVSWVDLGSRWNDPRGLIPRSGLPEKLPRYHVMGWVGLWPEEVAELLTRGKMPLNGLEAWIAAHDASARYPLKFYAPPEEQWVDVHGHENGGFMKEVPMEVSRDELCFRSDVSKPALLHPRKERSYLGIIAAMRALLMDKEGGNFLNPTKVIGALEERYSSFDGVSKRNLETVFSAIEKTFGGSSGREGTGRRN